MATSTSTKLKLGFKDASGDDFSVNFNHADSGATAQQVKNLMLGMISYGSIFQRVPTVKKSAQFITTTNSDIDID